MFVSKALWVTTSLFHSTIAPHFLPYSFLALAGFFFLFRMKNLTINTWSECEARNFLFAHTSPLLCAKFSSFACLLACVIINRKWYGALFLIFAFSVIFRSLSSDRLRNWAADAWRQSVRKVENNRKWQVGSFSHNGLMLNEKRLAALSVCYQDLFFSFPHCFFILFR